MKVKYGEALTKEVMYSEEYCSICGELKDTAELKIVDGEGQLSYCAICKNCLKKLLEDFKKYEDIK